MAKRKPDPDLLAKVAYDAHNAHYGGNFPSFSGISPEGQLLWRTVAAAVARAVRADEWKKARAR